MATLAITVPAGKDPRAVLDALAKKIKRVAQDVPNNPTGGATVITIDNAPAFGVVSVQVTSGPAATNAKKVFS